MCFFAFIQTESEMHLWILQCAFVKIETILTPYVLNFYGLQHSNFLLS